MTIGCRGCHSEKSPFGCPPRFKERADRCPCIICLVKGVCITSCEEHESFVDESRRESLGNPVTQSDLI